MHPDRLTRSSLSDLHIVDTERQVVAARLTQGHTCAVLLLSAAAPDGKASDSLGTRDTPAPFPMETTPR